MTISKFIRIFGLLLFINFIIVKAQLPFTIEEMATLPVSVSNNAVSEGVVNGETFVYSFSGIDSSLDHSGIHLKSWRFSESLNAWEALDSLPDSKGKIAAAASRVGGVIYIIGGYHVAANGNETSSEKVHRFNTSTNTFLSDGAPIPVAIDDHVQSVWRDSLIYVVTGWSNTTNVPNVQIYNPTLDSWTVGTSVPNNNLFKVFGASGTIIGDTLYYYGGSSLGFNFPATFQLRKGYIDPNNPSQISWSVDTLSSDFLAYRTAAINLMDTVFFIGGSLTSYNYDAIAYNGNGLVAPSSRILMYETNSSFELDSSFTIPMDLRGLAKTSENEFYLVGGIGANGIQSNKLLKFTWRKDMNVSVQTKSEVSFKIFPNPTFDKLIIQDDLDLILTSQLFDAGGELIADFAASKVLGLSGIPKGIYFLRLQTKKGVITEKVVIN